MKILLLNCDLGPLKGHEVRQINFAHGGIISLRKLLHSKKIDISTFQPDLLVQRELLGRRLLVRDLDVFPCLKIFWSIDSHLNMFWQRWYCRLFDLVLTPHASLFKQLPQKWNVGSVKQMSFPGYDRHWRPHSSRNLVGAFVGRLDDNRDQRVRFAQFLHEKHRIKTQRLPFDEMLNLYCNVRVLPNESICQEFNFRIMEGASCGCCVITEEIGEDLEANFRPGKEILTYRHALELDELITFLKKRPNLTEKIGLAAWQRVQNYHLPSHRWQSLLKMARQFVPSHISSWQADYFCFRAAAQIARELNDADTCLHLATMLANLPATPDIKAMRLRLMVENGWHDKARCLLEEILTDFTAQTVDNNCLDVDLRAACVGAAILMDDTSPLHDKCRSLAVQPNGFIPCTLFQTVIAMAHLLQQAGRICQPGFAFNPVKHCPETAIEMLLAADRLAKSSDERRQLHFEVSHLADYTPLLTLNLNSKAHVSLANTDDWRASFAYAMACLKTFRLSDGLAELSLAEKLADRHGNGKIFSSFLREHGLSNYVNILHSLKDMDS